MPQHHTISSKDYINSLEFDYMETYSLLRGQEFEAEEERMEAEFDQLELRQEKGETLSVDEDHRFSELKKRLLEVQYLIDQDGQFHPSSTKTHTVKATDPRVERLRNILRTEFSFKYDWMCAPVYRDAVVFYDKEHRIVSTLNVCLGCQYMETQPFTYIEGDLKTYEQLRQFFLDLGHQVEDAGEVSTE